MQDDKTHPGQMVQADKFASLSSSSRSPVWEEVVESVADEPLLEDEERRGGSISSIEVLVANADAIIEVAALLTRLNRLGISAKSMIN